MGALYSWKMFDVGWARLVPADAPVEVGTTVAVLAKTKGITHRPLVQILAHTAC